MLLIPSKYRVARRLGAGVFEQTQTQKFALRDANRSPKSRGRGPSDFGRQLIEKQRVRFTYGLSEKQLANYVHKSIGEKDPQSALNVALEMRADMVMYRAGLANTRRSARQAVSHGHLLINGKRTTSPSYKLRIGDVISIREGVRKSPLYAGLAENGSSRAVPAWLKTDINLLNAEILSVPQYHHGDGGLDFAVVFEFYSR